MGVGARQILLAGAPAGTFTTIFSRTLNANAGGMGGTTVRQVIDSSLWSPALSGTKIRITFNASSTQGLALTDVQIGQKAAAGDDYDFASTPTRITFNSGGTGFTAISASQSKLSDDVAFSFDATKSYVIAMAVAGGANGMRQLSGVSGAAGYFIAGNDVTTVNASGYSSLADLACISLVEVL